MYVNFYPRGLVRVCVCVWVHCTVSKHTLLQIWAELAGPPSDRHVVRLEKVEDTNTLQTHTRFLSSALFRWQNISSPSPHEIFRPPLCVDGCGRRAGQRCVSGVFSGFLCTLCLDCGLLLTSLWLQTHWHVIYGNEPWRKLSRINQTHPTCTVCVSLSVCVWKREMVKEQTIIKRDTEGKCVRLMGFFPLLMFFNVTSNNKEAINPHEDGIKSKVVQKYYPCPKPGLYSTSKLSKTSVNLI